MRAESLSDLPSFFVSLLSFASLPDSLDSLGSFDSLDFGVLDSFSVFFDFSDSFSCFFLSL